MKKAGETPAFFKEFLLRISESPVIFTVRIPSVVETFTKYTPAVNVATLSFRGF